MPALPNASTRLALLLGALAGCAGGAAAPDSVMIFAAASLTDAVTEIATAASADTGIAVETSFAASSTLAAQILAGAPADVFLSADPTWMDELERRGRIDAASRVQPITTTLVVVAPRERAASIGDPPQPGAILSALGPTGRLAVGDPDHVPAGRYARAALETLGLWPILEPRLARAQDVRAALVLVARGEAPLGIVYAADTHATDAVRIVGTLPPGSHPPIRFVFAIVAGRGTPRVQTIHRWLTGADARGAFTRHGFEATA